MSEAFLPEAPENEEDRFDVVIVTGDAYVDHPSFGSAMIGRYLESLGYRVGILSQPKWTGAEEFRRFGRPRLFFGVTAGNVDSMVANYTPDRRKREHDEYSPGGVPGKRPDHAALVYAQRCKEAYPDVPVVMGGIEASLRRLSHFDFVQQKVRGSILADAKADFLVYGMGERAIKSIAEGLSAGKKPEELRWIRGTAYLASEAPAEEGVLLLPSAEETIKEYDSFYEFHKMFRQAASKPYPPKMAQPHGARFVVVNQPADPLTPEELNSLYELPFSRAVPPRYAALGGVPAIETVRFSIVTHRGCYGGCSFCALYAHQGKGIVSRPAEGILGEVQRIALRPDFRGTIPDIGGPTANMYGTKCNKGSGEGRFGCERQSCLYPEVCKNLETSGAPYLELLRSVRRVQGVKHLFIASGLRHDLLVLGPQRRLFREIVQYHVGGQMKIAPEHVSARPLRLMKKPPLRVYTEFLKLFEQMARECGKELYPIPYLIAGHPGSNLEDALDLARYVRQRGRSIEQAQQFTPTPMTDSTCMYVTRRDPETGEGIFIPSGAEAKIQKSLLQLNSPRALEKVTAYFERIGKSGMIADLVRGRGPAPARAGFNRHPARDTSGAGGRERFGSRPADDANKPQSWKKKI